MSGIASGAGAACRLPLGDRVIAIGSIRGAVGVAHDGLLRRLGIAGDDLTEVLDRLRGRGLVPLHGSSMDSSCVFNTA